MKSVGSLKQTMKNLRQSGFTIVELLIVIVVIGILAALVLNAFSGVQTKAANTQTMEAVGAYVKGIKAYGIDKGVYPPIAGTVGCLGSPFTNGWCASLNGSSTACNGYGTAGTDPAFNTAIKQYMGQTLPLTSSQQISCGGSPYGGAYYYNPAPNTVTIVVFLNGNIATCPSIGGVTNSYRYQQDSVTACAYLFPPL